MARITVNYEFGQQHKLDGGAVEHEICFSVKEGPLQIRRDDDNITRFSE